MTTVIAGMTPTEFILAVNSNFPSESTLNESMLSGEFITTFHANYEYNKTIDSDIPAKATLIIGMTGAQYIAALNWNFTNIEIISEFTEVDYIIPNNRGSEYGCLLDQLYCPAMIKLASGKQLIGGISRGGVMSRENFCVIRNINGNYSNPYLMGFEATTEGTYDSHSKASFIEKTGILYAFHEALVGVSDDLISGHGSEIIAKKSLDEGQTWAEITRFGSEMSYAKVCLISGNFYVIARDQVRWIAVWKSTDDCENWTKLSTPYGTAVGWWSYHGIPANTGNEINITIFERTFVDEHSVWPYVGHIRSTDGVTYYNTEKTWSKNVVNDGWITRVELVTNCLISVYTVDDNVTGYGGAFMKGDKLYSLIAYGHSYTTPSWGSGLIDIIFSGLKIYEGKTEILDISDLLSGATITGYMPVGYMNFFVNGDTFDVLLIDVLNNNDIKLYNFNNSELLSTRLLRIGEVSAETITMGTGTINVLNRADRFLVLGKLTGSWDDLDNSYIDFIIFEPK
jgi:hypothetical protein